MYLRLNRKYKEVYYLEEKKECDFVAIEKGKTREVIQSCYDLNADNLERETTDLYTTLLFFGLTVGKTVALNQKKFFERWHDNTGACIARIFNLIITKHYTEKCL